MHKLNLKLRKQFGDKYFLQCFAGRELESIPPDTLLDLARCYAKIFTEDWNEHWTVEAALQEIRNFITCDPAYFPVMTLLSHEDRVIGFGWAYIIRSEALSEEGAPFSSSPLKQHECVSVARYWLDFVGHKKMLVSIRELGVLKEHRQGRTPFLTLPIFEQARAADCEVAFFRTRTTSQAFKWGVGVGFVPLLVFMVDDLVLMKGSVKYAMSLLYGCIDDGNCRTAQTEIIGNINRYLCN